MVVMVVMGGRGGTGDRCPIIGYHPLPSHLAVLSFPLMWGLCQLPIMCLSSLSPHLLSLSILPLPGPLVLPFVCHPHHFSLASLTSSPFSPFSHSLNSQSLFFPSISSSIYCFSLFSLPLFLSFTSSAFHSPPSSSPLFSSPS